MAQNAIDEASSTSSRRDRSRNPFVRFFAGIVTFLKQVIDELKKVVTPTWRELISYTLVVLVFVVIMMLFVSGLDFVFGNAVGWVFGGDLPFSE